MRNSLIALVGMLALCLAAQSQAGSLSGRVIDPDGKAVERIESDVTALDASGRKFTGKLSRDGSYRIDALPGGTYSLDLDLPTRLFERFARAGVEVGATDKVILDLRLEWG